MPNRSTTLRRPTLAARAAAPLPRTQLAPEGIVVGIVAVTGTVDSVEDLIVPGAFAGTLLTRRPKLCWHHDWKDPLGRVLHIEELKPRDKRLPKVLPDGRRWPAEAGAVIASMQFNMQTIRGREMFAHAQEWAKNGEAAFSIGYKVTPGMASKRADGVRLIYGLELFEVSLVLHGAHNMALALEVKDAGAGPDLTYRDAPLGAFEVKAAEKMAGNGAMVALFPPADVAAQLAHEDGTDPEHLHVTLAFLGSGDEVTDPAALVDALAPATAGTGPLTGTLGGIGTFPPGDDGTPVWVPVDVPGLVELRQRVVDALEAAGHPQKSEHGYTPHLTLGYDLSSIEPAPSTPVTFTEAALVVGEQRFPLTLDGPTPTPMEGKAAAAAVAQARGLQAQMEGKSALAAVYEAKSGVPGIADTPSDHAAVQRLRESWTDGTMAAKIGWGTDGDFMRCVALATEHMGPEDAKGWCNLRHHDALGIYPATHAKLEGKTAASAVLEAKSAPWDESLHPRGAKGTPGGGKFIAKGAGYSSNGYKSKEAMDVRKAQQGLVKGGFLRKQDGRDGNAVDGLFGPKTDAAVRRWQKSAGKTVNGRLSSADMKALSGILAARKTAAKSGTHKTAAKSGTRKPRHRTPAQQAVHDRNVAERAAGHKRAIEAHQRSVARKAAAAKRRADKAKGKSPSTLTHPGKGPIKVPSRVEHLKSGSISYYDTKSTPTSQETKAMPAMSGSHEERREALRRAVDKLFSPKASDSSRDGMDPCGAGIEATFDDHVVVTRWGKDEESYSIPYVFTPDGDVELGQPVEVELTVVATPENEKDEPGEVEEGAAVNARFIDPAVAFLADASRMIYAAPEGKSLDGITNGLLGLLDSLAAKGYDVASAVLGDDEEAEPNPDDESAEGDLSHDDLEGLADDLDADGDGEVDDDEDGDGAVTLDADAVRKQMEDLRA